MQSNTKTVAEYLKSLPKDRRKAISEVRKVIKKNLPKGYKEIMNYGMIGYVVPLSLYPDGYLGKKDTPLPYAALGSQKNHMAVYLTNVYADHRILSWFTKEYKKTGKKLNMGKSCVRFTKLENLPLDVIGKTIAKTSVQQFIELYEKSREEK